MFFILIRYFVFVLRFLVFFKKSQNVLDHIQNGTTIRIPDIAHFDKDKDVYTNIEDDKNTPIFQTDEIIPSLTYH